jgi:hypothetical protein
MLATDQTVRMRSAHVAVRSMPNDVGIDAKTVRQRVVDLAVKPLPGAIADRIPRTVQTKPSNWVVARILLILLLSSMPILGISVDVFGLVSQSTTSVAVIVVTAVLATIMTFAPHRIDTIVARGLIAGMVACIVYDGARLFAVHVLGLMGDFIPVMGSWVTGEPDTVGSAAVGYVWRYLGDGGGLGVAFFVMAFVLGIDRWSSVRAVLAAVGFAVFPTWTGLIATVALAPRGQQMMFPLNTATITITLVGHLIFGLVLGLAFLKAPRGEAHREWPYPPLNLRRKRAVASAQSVPPAPRHG